MGQTGSRARSEVGPTLFRAYTETKGRWIREARERKYRQVEEKVKRQDRTRAKGQRRVGERVQKGTSGVIREKKDDRQRARDDQGQVLGNHWAVEGGETTSATSPIHSLENHLTASLRPSQLARTESRVVSHADTSLIAHTDRRRVRRLCGELVGITRCARRARK